MTSIIRIFRTPLSVIAFGLLYTFFEFFAIAHLLAIMCAVIAVAIGVYSPLREFIDSLRKRHFALDYIAFLAISVAFATNNYGVAVIIAIMLSSGATLETYAFSRATKSLTALTNRIPNQVVLWEKGKSNQTKLINQVEVGEIIVVRKGEVVPLDGILISEHGLTDESSLTGEPYLMEKIAGDMVRSGTVNTGDVLVMKVEKPDRDSAYRRIIQLVEHAQTEKAPLVRLADKYSTLFTIITLLISAFAYAISHDIARVLAVLVVATPCPLILATPIALFSGVNAAARQRILVKKLGSLESLARVTSLVLDKTGTITLGRPIVHEVIIIDKKLTLKKVCAIAEAIERNSLHPFAKAIVENARQLNIEHLPAEHVVETIGQGISARIQGEDYILRGAKSSDQSTIELFQKEGKEIKLIAQFLFEDQLKDDAISSIKELRKFKLNLAIYSGDREDRVRETLVRLDEVGSSITIKGSCTPEQKKDGIAELKSAGQIVGMVGDGINDAPALALADVGMVFSNEEHTAASEAADIIFLGGDLSAVTRALLIARRTIAVALQSIGWGIGLSIVAMIAAAVGYIPPVAGAILQEGIDVLVILNALRAGSA